VVIIGFVPDEVGKVEASITYKPESSQLSQDGWTTLLLGSLPILHVPIWCAENSGTLQCGKRTLRNSAASLSRAFWASSKDGGNCTGSWRSIAYTLSAPAAAMTRTPLSTPSCKASMS